MSSVGKTEHSFRKHALLQRVLESQFYAHARGRKAPVLLLDLTAGDGNGVALPQQDLFLTAVESWTTPALLTRLAQGHPNVQVVLCEKVGRRRALLQEKFPGATVLEHSALAPSWITATIGYCLVVSDPNGLRDHNLAAMAAIAQQLPRSDFILTFNEWSLKRLLGVMPPTPEAHHIVRDAWAAQEAYRWMQDPQAWKARLRKNYYARTRTLIQASPNYRYRMLVVSNYLGDAVRRHPQEWEVF
jgi:hypothetical protein